MGKPDPGISPDNVSLHTQPGGSYRNAPDHALPDGADDLPPLYDDLSEAGGSTSQSAPLLPSYSSPDNTGGVTASSLQPFRHDDTRAYYLDARLDNDPEHLESQVREWAARPPRPFVRAYGYHNEPRRNKDGKTESRKITDFDVQVEVTPYLYADAAARQSWRELRTVGNDDQARRGTVFRCRAACCGTGSIQLGQLETPSLTQWCHMYCASHSGLKSFVLRRRVLGFDEDAVKERVACMVRDTNYKGHLQVSFLLRDETVEIWNDCRVNRWRLTKWICMLFYVSMLWLLTWPYLFCRTKKFETVTADWYFSKDDGEGRKRYVSLSESQWYNLWGRALAKAVLSKRQGTLNQQDLLAAEGADSTFTTGNATVDGALSVLRAGVGAMNEVNRHLGWGQDQC